MYYRNIYNHLWRDLIETGRGVWRKRHYYFTSISFSVLTLPLGLSWTKWSRSLQLDKTWVFISPFRKPIPFLVLRYLMGHLETLVCLNCILLMSVKDPFFPSHQDGQLMGHWYNLNLLVSIRRSLEFLVRPLTGMENVMSPLSRVSVGWMSVGWCTTRYKKCVVPRIYVRLMKSRVLLFVSIQGYYPFCPT